MIKHIGSFVIGTASLITGIEAFSKAFKGHQLSDVPIPVLPKNGGAARNGKSKSGYTAKIYNVTNINSRVKHIQRLIEKGKKDPEVRAFAVKAVSQKCGNRFCIPERDYWGEVKAIFDSIRSNVRYVRDGHRVDVFQSAKRTLEFSGADCDDFSITMGSALQSIGYPIRLRVIQTKDSPEWNHIFLLVGLPPRSPTKWVSLDASVDKPAGWHPPRHMIVKVKDFSV